MKANQDHLTQITELRAANLALEEEIRALKRTQATLRDDHLKFLTIVEQASEGIVVTQDLQKVYYNPAWLKLIGYSAQDYEALPLLSLVHPDDLELAKKTYFQLAMEVYEFRIITKSGDVKWIAAQTSKIEWEGKPAELFIVEDITERKKMEQALAKSEAHLQRAQEVAHTGSWELDLIRGELIWSDETYRIFGLPRETPMDYETFLNCVMPADRNYVDEKWQAALAGAPYDIEHRICVGDVVKWVREKAEIEFDQADRATKGIGVVIDITERKQTEQALQVSEQNLREAQAIAHVGHWEWDIPNDQIYWSDEVYRMFGLDPVTELNYDTLMATIHPEDRDYHNEITAAWIKNRGGEPYEYRIILADGSIRYIYATGKVECNEAGEPIRFIGTIQDITPLKLTEINLRESEARFRATFEQAAVGIAHVGLDGRFLRLNQKFCEIVGYAPDEMLKLTFQDITHPDDLEADLEYVQKLMEGQIATYSMEKRYFKKDGDIVWVNLTVALVRTTTGDPNYAISVIEDITERKRAQEELQASEQRFSTLFENAAMGIALVDTHGHPIISNPALQQFLGYSSEELRDMAFSEFTHPEDIDIDVTLSNELFANLRDDYQIEKRFITKDGQTVWGRLTASVVREKEGGQQLGIGMVEDISEHKRAEEELQASEQRFSALFENAAIGIALVDPRGHPFVSNPALERFLGYSSEELRGMAFREFTHPEDADIDLTLFNELIANLRDDYQIEKRYLTKDGRTVWGRLTVSIVRENEVGQQFAIGMVEDITERKQIEQALNESELKYRTVVEQATEGIMVVQDYERKYYNSAFREMTGYSIEEYESNPFMALIHPDDVDAVEEFYQVLVSQQEDVFFEFRIYTKSGDIKWLSIHGASIEWEGRPAGMIIANDITERKHWEQQIQSYQLQLKALATQLTLTEEQERRRIAAELHDQVGQSLAFTRMQIAAAKNARSDDQRDALLDETSATLKETIQETRSLVFDLSSPLLNELGLNAAISEWMEERLEKQAGLKTELIEIGSDSHLSADLRAIVFRSVRELFNNIIRYARATCVRVTVEQTDIQFYVTVQDDGVGFQPEEIAPGLTRSGGFGLFSIQERMSNLGGSCTIQSAPGEGTQITLCLPIRVIE